MQSISRNEDMDVDLAGPQTRNHQSRIRSSTERTYSATRETYIAIVMTYTSKRAIGGTPAIQQGCCRTMQVFRMRKD